MHKASCLCGAIKLDVMGCLADVEACHCRLCRKWSGHIGVTVEVARDSVITHGKAHLQWYHSSEKVRRGFCRHCGTSIFFDPLDQQKHHWIAIAMGIFDTPTHTQLTHHIFVAEKGDYYEIDDGLPQNEY